MNRLNIAAQTSAKTLAGDCMKRLFALIIFLPLLGKCGHQESNPPVEARQLWAEQALVEGGIPNVWPPTKLDILMDPRDNMQTGLSMWDRCQAWGGHLEFQRHDASYICPDIDY